MYSDIIVVWMWYSTGDLGNMIYHGLITLQLCRFPFTEIGVVSHITTEVIYFAIIQVLHITINKEILVRVTGANIF